MKTKGELQQEKINIINSCIISFQNNVNNYGDKSLELALDDLLYLICYKELYFTNTIPLSNQWAAFPECTSNLHSSNPSDDNNTPYDCFFLLWEKMHLSLPNADMKTSFDTAKHTVINYICTRYVCNYFLVATTNYLSPNDVVDEDDLYHSVRRRFMQYVLFESTLSMECKQAFWLIYSYSVHLALKNHRGSSDFYRRERIALCEYAQSYFTKIFTPQEQEFLMESLRFSFFFSDTNNYTIMRYYYKEGKNLDPDDDERLWNILFEDFYHGQLNFLFGGLLHARP